VKVITVIAEEEEEGEEEYLFLNILTKENSRKYERENIIERDEN